jgi:phenylacetate-CoA ligase
VKLEFSSIPFQGAGFSEQPMTILDAAEPKAMLCSVFEVALLETGDRRARGRWQRAQLRNLLRHSSERSTFWRKRIGGTKHSDIELAALPIQTRHDVIEQVTSDGPLLQPRDGIPTQEHSTSGSTGTPVRFFYSGVNGQYNFIRSTAQYFMEGREISFNRTRLNQGHKKTGSDILVKKEPSWLGPLASIFKTGLNKSIEYVNPSTQELVTEFKKDQIGYLVCQPRILDAIFASHDPTFFKEAKTRMWITVGEKASQELVDIFSKLEIPVRSTYSSEEVGPIGFECASCPGHYHVATSNVLVEIGDESYAIGGARLGKVLVTHLHSYATPFIRYDLGDLACLREDCPCGHDGATIYDLQGRLSSILKHRDGRVSPFLVRGAELAALAQFTEYRMRQTGFEKIVIELAGRADVTAQEVFAIGSFLKQRAGSEFEIEVKACQEIDWGQSRKRYGFRCEIP